MNRMVGVWHFIITGRKLAPTLPLKYPRQEITDVLFNMDRSSKQQLNGIVIYLLQKSKSSRHIKVYGMDDFKICILRHYTTACPSTSVELCIAQINNFINRNLSFV